LVGSLEAGASKACSQVAYFVDEFICYGGAAFIPPNRVVDTLAIPGCNHRKYINTI